MIVTAPSRTTAAERSVRQSHEPQRWAGVRRDPRERQTPQLLLRSLTIMVTFAVLDAMARELPGVEARLSRDGRPEYRVASRVFACLRARRRDALDPETGEPMDDVIMLRTLDVPTKDALLADPRTPLFTTAHFDGYAAVLVRTRDLGRLGEDRLRDVVVMAWRSQAPTRLVRAHDEGDGATASRQP